MVPRLYMVHVGWYDPEPHGGPMGGVFESHTNHFVVAQTAQEAKAKTKLQPWYSRKNCHTDGVQEIVTVDGYDITLVHNESAMGHTLVNSFPYNVLNPEKMIGGQT